MFESLDDVQDAHYRASALKGDDLVDYLASLTPAKVAWLKSDAVPEPSERNGECQSLAGAWVMASSEPQSRERSMVDWEHTAFWQHHAGGQQPQWWRPDTDRSSWMEVRVPTTVQAALIDGGVLPDPNWASNNFDELVEHGEPSLWPWHFRRTRVEQQEWWFARSFSVPAEWNDADVLLEFEGLAYAASVYVNGQSIGYHEGMYGGPRVRIGDLLIRGGENQIVVRIDAAPEDWYGRPIGSAAFGWHYGHLIALGIWGDVTIRPISSVEVRGLAIRTAEILPNGTARAIVGFEVANMAAVDGDAQVTVEFEANAALKRFAANVPLVPGRMRYEGTVDITDAELWWPAGFGEQNLYEVRLVAEFSDASKHQPAVEETTRTGLRTVETRSLAAWTGPDSYEWGLLINGQEIFMKGANWCALDPLLRPARDRYTRILKLTRDANIQFLRAWGAGHPESGAFYEICDELGILVYQEFPIAWGPPDAPHADLGVMDRQAREIIERLKNHPSLVMWGGGNENNGPVGADEVLTLLGKRARALDPSRPFHRSSPWGGNQHNYKAYHGDMESLEGSYRSEKPVLYGEWGLPSLPVRASVERYLPGTTLATWPPDSSDGAVLAHQPQFSMFDFVKQLRNASYGPIRSWDDMIDYSQLAQADALRFAAEYLRAMPAEESAGFWFYKMTDNFPGNSWAVIDHYGVPKPAYFEAKRVCRNRTAFLAAEKQSWKESEDFDAQIWAANDLATHLQAGVSVELFDENLELVHSASEQFGLLPGQRSPILSVSLSRDVHRGRVFLARVVLHEDASQAEAWYWFNASSRTDEIQRIEATPLALLREESAVELIASYSANRPAPLRSLPRTTLEAFIDEAEIVIRNTGTRPAFRVTIEGLDDPSDYLEDNWFCLAAGDQRRIAFSSVRMPATVSAWNADELEL